LSVGNDLAVGCVDTGEVGVLGIARLEDFILGGIGSVVGASNTVVDVLAVVGGVGAGWVAGLEAEGIGADEVGPLDDLDVRSTTTECVGEDDASHGITTEISTVGVHLTSRVTRCHVDFGLVHEAYDLDVVGGRQHLDTSEGAIGDEASTVASLAAPGNHFALNISHGLVWRTRGPKTKVIQTIEKRGLTHGLLVLGRGITDIVASLSTANEALIGVDFIWDSRRVRKMF